MQDNFDVELQFCIPFHADDEKVRVIIPSRGTIQGRTVSPEPQPRSPRSEDWCREFGVISRELLSLGIVEKRSDGTLVVYRKFRHTPDRLTPFGLWSDRNKNVHSTSGLTVYTDEEYRNLERACCGTPCSNLTVTAVPLLSEKNKDINTGQASVDIHLYCPAVLSEIPPGPEKEDPNLISLDPDLYTGLNGTQEVHDTSL